MLRITLIALLATAVTGCVEYNEACTAPVDDPKGIIAKLTNPIFIDKPNARHANNAFGQAAADAFKNAFGEGKPGAAQLGIINSGDIRNEGYCTPRNSLRGQIRKADVPEVLLFDNLVYSLEMTEEQLIRAFQHSVNSLTVSSNPASPAPQEIPAPPARFLQVSKEVQLKVNCGNPSGSRVTSALVNGKEIVGSTNTTVKYRVAMPEFLMLGGDGYAAFKEAYDVGGGIQTEDVAKEARITATYLADKFGNKDPPLVTEQRVQFTGCAIPLPPAN